MRRAFYLPRITKTTHTRHYRYSKKNPKAFRQVTTFDLGNVEQQTRLSFRMKNLQKTDLEVNRELNPNLFSVQFGQIRLAYYIDDDKGFVYDKDGFFSGRFDKYDLTRFFSQISPILKVIKLRTSRNILRISKNHQKQERNEKGRFENEH